MCAFVSSFGFSFFLDVSSEVSLASWVVWRFGARLSEETDDGRWRDWFYGTSTQFPERSSRMEETSPRH